MRAFIALGLPESLLDALESVQEGMPGRVVARENLHLTLAFLGEIEQGQLARLHEGLLALRLPAPVLRVTGVDLFGGRKPTLCFAGVEQNAELSAARTAVRQVCLQAGVPLKRERFRAHVTLSRFGRALSDRDAALLAGRLGMLSIPGQRAARMGLFRSQLLPGGARYECLAEYALS